MHSYDNPSYSPENQPNPGVYPPQQNPAIYPPQQNPGVYPPQQNPGVYPPQQNPGVYPPQQNPGGAFPPQQQQQQQQQTTIVINQQPHSAMPIQPQNIREWNAQLCGCCDDMEEFLCCLLCYHCYISRVATKMDEYYWGPRCCGPCFMIPMRTKIRTQYGIKGSILKDMCIMLWLEPCAMNQIHRQLKQFAPSTAH